MALSHSPQINLMMDLAQLEQQIENELSDLDNLNQLNTNNFSFVEDNSNDFQINNKSGIYNFKLNNVNQNDSVPIDQNIDEFSTQNSCNQFMTINDSSSGQDIFENQPFQTGFSNNQTTYLQNNIFDTQQQFQQKADDTHNQGSYIPSINYLHNQSANNLINNSNQNYNLNLSNVSTNLSSINHGYSSKELDKNNKFNGYIQKVHGNTNSIVTNQPQIQQHINANTSQNGKNNLNNSNSIIKGDLKGLEAPLNLINNIQDEQILKKQMILSDVLDWTSVHNKDKSNLLQNNNYYFQNQQHQNEKSSNRNYQEIQPNQQQFYPNLSHNQDIYQNNKVSKIQEPQEDFDFDMDSVGQTKQNQENINFQQLNYDHLISTKLQVLNNNSKSNHSQDLLQPYFFNNSSQQKIIKEQAPQIQMMTSQFNSLNLASAYNSSQITHGNSNNQQPNDRQNLNNNNFQNLQNQTINHQNLNNNHQNLNYNQQNLNNIHHYPQKFIQNQNNFSNEPTNNHQNPIYHQNLSNSYMNLSNNTLNLSNNHINSQNNLHNNFNKQNPTDNNKKYHLNTQNDNSQISNKQMTSSQKDQNDFSPSFVKQGLNLSYRVQTENYQPDFKNVDQSLIDDNFQFIQEQQDTMHLLNNRKTESSNENRDVSQRLETEFNAESTQFTAKQSHRSISNTQRSFHDSKISQFSYGVIPLNKPKFNQEIEKCSFAPMLSQQSMIIAQKLEKPLDRLTNSHEKTQLKIQKKQIEFDNQYNYHPVTNQILPQYLMKNDNLFPQKTERINQSSSNLSRHQNSTSRSPYRIFDPPSYDASNGSGMLGQGNSNNNEKITRFFKNELYNDENRKNDDNIHKNNSQIGENSSNMLPCWERLFQLNQKREIQRKIKQMEYQRQLADDPELTFQPRLGKTQSSATFYMGDDTEFNIAERNLCWMNKKEEQLKKQRQTNKSRETVGCTFKPQIHSIPELQIQNCRVSEFEKQGIIDYFQRIQLAQQKRKSQQRDLNQIDGSRWKNKLTVPIEFQFMKQNGDKSARSSKSPVSHSAFLNQKLQIYKSSQIGNNLETEPNDENLFYVKNNPHYFVNIDNDQEQNYNNNNNYNFNQKQFLLKNRSQSSNSGFVDTYENENINQYDNFQSKNAINQLQTRLFNLNLQN